MPAKKYDNEIVRLYNFLKDNPLATYEQMEELFKPETVNANSLVKRLQRMGCVKIEREIDARSGKILGSRKVCLRTPSV